MFILGHAGITLGTAALLNIAITKAATHQATEHLEPSPKIDASHSSSVNRISSWITSPGNRVGIRLLLIGSLLPDIIDKPVGQLIFRETFSNGKIFAHTLLFLILITLAGVFLYRRYNKNWLVILSFGTLMHLILDQMWRAPQTLLWPLFGLTFEKVDFTNWVSRRLHALLTDPAVYVPELVGGAILILFVWVLLSNRRLFASIRRGRAFSV